jgi:hemicentin
VNGDYSEWSEWERCSSTCGGGKQFRSRTCTNPLAQYGGMNCDSKGPPREERICNTNLCPGRVELLSFNFDSPAWHLFSDNHICEMFSVDGGYSLFGNWSVCSATCGGGNMTRTRSCSNPVPAMGGKDCSQFGFPVEVMKCNEQQCPSKALVKNVFIFPSDGMSVVSLSNEDGSCNSHLRLNANSHRLSCTLINFKF